MYIYIHITPACWLCKRVIGDWRVQSLNRLRSQGNTNTFLYGTRTAICKLNCVGSGLILNARCLQDLWILQPRACGVWLASKSTGSFRAVMSKTVN